MALRLAAEFLGTAILVFIGVGVATMVFGFHVFGIRGASAVAAGVLTVGMSFGLTLTAVHIFGIAIDGTTVNPARSLGPALITGGTPLRQVWLFILAPLVGGVLAAGTYLLLHPTEPAPAEGIAATDGPAGHPALAHAAADVGAAAAGQATAPGPARPGPARPGPAACPPASRGGSGRPASLNDPGGPAGRQRPDLT
jgi:glycerol uptake facilitator-like aquaporin